jgi:hypothetical protein
MDRFSEEENYERTVAFVQQLKQVRRLLIDSSR